LGRVFDKRRYVVTKLLGASALFALAAWAAAPAVKTIQPHESLSVSQIINLPEWAALRVREIRAAPDGVWLLVCSKAEPTHYAIADVGLNGQLHRFIDLSQGVQASGLAATAHGVATALLKRGSGVRPNWILTEYDPSGGLVAESTLDCFWAGGLIALGGHATTLCPDGTVTQYSKGSAPVKSPSWYHPGSSVLPLSSHHMVIVDQASGKAVFNELSNNTVSQITAQVPEVDAALAHIAAKTKELLPEAAAHFVRPLVALDTTADRTGWYMLIGPCNKATGLQLAKFDFTGQLVARLLLQVPVSLPGVLEFAAEDGAELKYNVTLDYVVFDDGSS
jgi:hypothetical protein